MQGPDGFHVASCRTWQRRQQPQPGRYLSSESHCYVRAALVHLVANVCIRVDDDDAGGGGGGGGKISGVERGRAFRLSSFAQLGQRSVHVAGVRRRPGSAWGAPRWRWWWCVCIVRKGEEYSKGCAYVVIENRLPSVASPPRVLLETAVVAVDGAAGAGGDAVWPLSLLATVLYIPPPCYYHHHCMNGAPTSYKVSF